MKQSLAGQPNTKGCVKPTSKTSDDEAVTQDDIYSGENLGEQLAKQVLNQTRKKMF